MRTIHFIISILLALLPSWGLTQQLEDRNSYLLGPEDVIVVTVLGHPEFSGEYLIPSSGSVIMPVVGAISVAGLTPDGVTAKVKVGLLKRLRRPEVITLLKTPRPRRVTVLGDVRSAGIVEIKTGWRLTDTLGAAGGLPSGVFARDVTVTLERNETPRRTLSLESILGDPVNDILVQPGDSIRFQALDPIAVQVLGRVRAPGQIKFRGAEVSLLEVLTLAGGATDDAQLSAVKILRRDGTEEAVDLVPALQRGETSKLPLLRSGDSVIVTANENRFVVLGYIQRPGYYPMPVGQSITLAEAVATAAGTNDRSRLSRVGLLRTTEGKVDRQVYDLGRFLQKGDLSQNPLVRSGDVIYVPESNRVDIFRNLGALAGLSLVFTRLFR